MLDLTLLRILKHKNHYDRIVPSLPENALDPATRIVIDDFGAYLKETGHPVVKMGPFKSYFFNFRHPKLTDEKKKYFDALLTNCEKDVDVETTRVMANKLVELGFATDVGNDAQKYHNGGEIDIIHTVGQRHEVAKANIIAGDMEQLYVSDDINDLLAEDEDTSGLRFSLGCLRNGLRPLRSGDLVLVCGRPDTGKTSFLTSELVSMVHGLPEGRDVLWFNNEGQGNRIVKRLYQSFLGCDIGGLLQRRQEGTLVRDFQAALGHRVRVVDCHDWDTVMVEQVVQETEPGLVIFDMVDNITFKGDLRAGHDARTDQILEAQYQWARTLGVKYDHPVIATSQISAEVEQSVETQCYPPQHALKDSKTGKQGAADLMIMIGRSSDPAMDSARFISTPKNKLATGNVLIRQQVNFDGSIARYFDPIGA